MCIQPTEPLTKHCANRCRTLRSLSLERQELSLSFEREEDKIVYMDGDPELSAEKMVVGCERSKGRSQEDDRECGAVHGKMARGAVEGVVGFISSRFMRVRPSRE